MIHYYDTMIHNNDKFNHLTFLSCNYLLLYYYKKIKLIYFTFEMFLLENIYILNFCYY